MQSDYVDRIGDRLANPENVPAHLAHLIPDDLQRVQRILEFPVSGKILDVGCSDGTITRMIQEKWGVDAWGIDVRPDAFGATLDIREPLPPNFKDFDAVYACEVFEHMTDTDARKALHNIWSVLKPGGDLIVTVPNRYPADIYEVGCRARWAWPDHRSSYTAATLSELVFGHPERIGNSYFSVIEHTSLYDDESCNESIWFIARARGRK